MRTRKAIREHLFNEMKKPFRFPRHYKEKIMELAHSSQVNTASTTGLLLDVFADSFFELQQEIIAEEHEQLKKEGRLL